VNGINTAELAPATAAEARALTDQIKVAVDGTWQLIKHAYLSRAWSALGYSSWDDYCTQEFGTSRLRLPREERPEIVQSLREIGMSVRAIAAATGQGYGTVRRELAGEPNGSPALEPTWYEPNVEEQTQLDRSDAIAREMGVDLDSPDEFDDEPAVEPKRVTGTDGKSYAAQPTRTPNRPALPPQFRSVASDLTRLIARLEKLRQDGRYRSNRTSIADLCVPELRRASEVLGDLLDDLAQDDGDLK